MQNINFSTNWNEKLSGRCFTSLRIHNENKYVVGQAYTVVLNGKALGIARLIKIQYLHLRHINDWVGGIDTGYTGLETQQILKRMYIKKNINWETQLFDYMLFRYEVKSPSTQCTSPV